MITKNQITKLILWAARIWGSLSLAFLVFMILGDLFGTERSIGSGHSASFLFFPVSTIIGLSIAWKWEGIGGLITIGGIIGFHILRPDLFLDLMIDGLAAPGLLFLIYWLLSRDHMKTGETN
jgi:hypothetical protein